MQYEQWDEHGGDGVDDVVDDERIRYRIKHMEKVQKICQKIIVLSGILIFGYLTLYAWTSSARIYASSEVAIWTKDDIWKNLLFVTAALLISMGIGILTKKISDTALHAAAVIVSLAVAAGCCILAYSARSYPTADQIYVYEAASNFFHNDYNNIQTEWYFNACPYQLSLGLIFGMIMRICGRDGYLVIQYAQAFCIGITVYTSFRIAKELFCSKTVSIVVLLCAACFAPMHLYTLYLYGETFGVCFSMLGMLFWLLANKQTHEKKEITWLYWVLSALSFAVCYTVRPALVIVMIAMIATGMLKALTDRHWGSLGLTVLILLFAIAVQKFSVVFMEKQANVELADGIPAILTIAMGIQDEDLNENGTGPGSYNAYNLWLYFEHGFDGESAKAEAIYNIKQTLYRWSRNPAYMISYMNRKVLNQWNEATYDVFCMTAKQSDPEEWVVDLYTGRTGDRLYDFLDLFQGMMYFTLFIYFILLFREKKNIALYLPALLLLGEFFFSMIWEAKSRYIYPYIVMAMPCAAQSLACCAEFSARRIKKWKKGITQQKEFRDAA